MYIVHLPEFLTSFRCCRWVANGQYHIMMGVVCQTQGVQINKRAPHGPKLDGPLTSNILVSGVHYHWPWQPSLQEVMSIPHIIQEMNISQSSKHSDPDTHYYRSLSHPQETTYPLVILVFLYTWPHHLQSLGRCHLSEVQGSPTPLLVIRQRALMVVSLLSTTILLNSFIFLMLYDNHRNWCTVWVSWKNELLWKPKMKIEMLGFKLIG